MMKPNKAAEHRAARDGAGADEAGNPKHASIGAFKSLGPLVGGFAQDELNEHIIAWQRARNRKYAAARAFDEPYWNLTNALTWIAFRDQARMLDSWPAAKLYDRATIKERDPRRALLLALQKGELNGILDGRELAPDWWAARSIFQWPTVMRFRRAGVLNAFPTLDAAPRSNSIEKAVIECMKRYGRPPDSMPWSVFCDHVRDEADGWTDKKQGKHKRGFHTKTIKRAVDKLDK